MIDLCLSGFCAIFGIWDGYGWTDGIEKFIFVGD